MAPSSQNPGPVHCAHGYVLMQDSCPGCDAMEDTPHTAEMVTVVPSWAPSKFTRCLHCNQTASHEAHKGGAA